MKHTARFQRRASLLATRRGVEVLEGRELLSALAAERLHDSGAAVPSVSYYNADNVRLDHRPVSAWQGIRDGDTAGQYLISGTSLNNGLLFVGTIQGVGTSYAVNYPGASSTSVYGPNNLGGGNIQLVGSYKTGSRSTPTSSVIVNGFLYQGTTAELPSGGSYRTIDYPGATYTYVHSTMGGLAVGNYDSPTTSGTALGPGQCFIYDIATASFVTNIVYPGSVSDTAYGIWYNGGNSYTICGGFSDLPVNNGQNQNEPIGEGYLVDYNSATHQFSNWQAYLDPNGHNLTHFEGISSPAPGVYTLNADVGNTGSNSPGQGSWVMVERNPNGTFDPNAVWVNLNYPGAQGTTSSNSVAGNQVVGIASGNPGIRAIQATVNIDVPSATAVHGHKRHGRRGA